MSSYKYAYIYISGIYRFILYAYSIEQCHTTIPISLLKNRKTAIAYDKSVNLINR